jgi:hypothetical protein
MKPINNWNEIEAQGNEESKRLVPGGYVCRITSVTDNPEKQYLCIEFDICEGEYTGYGANMMERYGFTPLRMYRSYSEKAAGMFKGFIQDVEASNAPHYHWDWKEQSLVGRTIGVVLGEEEYRKNNGDVGTRFNVRTKTTAAIREGKFKVPEKKTLPVEQPTATFTAFEDASGELPF